MKIALLTSQASMNYGGILQAYALKTVFKELGYECDVINYKPAVHDIKKHPIRYITERKNGISKALFVAKHISDFKARKSKFESFKKIYLSPTPIESINKEQLCEVLEKYEYVCCGSDQLWNLNQKDNENKAFMLDFSYKFKSFSYAVSFGDALKVCPEKIDKAIPLIKKFSYISVREEEGLNYLSSKGISSVLSVDPTMLVESKFWISMIKKQKPIVSGDYILFYGYENAYQKNDDLINCTQDIAKCLKIPVINILMNPEYTKKFINMYKAGPVEFLNLIYNAKFVCTNSYHGTIFSHIFSTPFAVVYSKKSGLDGRKKTLLKMINQEWRAIGDIDEFNIDKFIADSGNNTNEEMNMRIMSIDYLKGVFK